MIRENGSTISGLSDKKGKVSSPKLQEEAMTHTLYADVDNNILTLNLASAGHPTIEEGEADAVEYNVMFSFILKNGKIKLHHIMTAGQLSPFWLANNRFWCYLNIYYTFLTN